MEQIIGEMGVGKMRVGKLGVIRIITPLTGFTILIYLTVDRLEFVSSLFAVSSCDVAFLIFIHSFQYIQLKAESLKMCMFSGVYAAD